jgi:hypothetical protein
LSFSGWFLYGDDPLVWRRPSWRQDDDPPLTLFNGYCPADFFLLLGVNSELAGLTLSQLGGVLQTKFSATNQLWIEYCKKCVRNGGDHVEKLPDIIVFS